MKPESRRADEVVMGRSWQAVFTAAFLLFLLVPASSLLVPSSRPRPSEEPASTLAGQLRDLDARFKSLPLFEHWRQRDQAGVTRYLGIGNRRVFVGRDGWLYYRPDLDAAAGKGALHREPASVAREESDKAWQAPIPVIADFAAQLRTRGIELLFVPVPTKPMIAREGIGLEAAAGAPEGWREALVELQGNKVEVLDLFPLLSQIERDGDAFLTLDTHWTPRSMEAAARAVAERIGVASRRDEPSNQVVREGEGDLVGMLGLGDRQTLFIPERVELREPHESPGGDDAAGVLLLGDSFANIYEDPALGFGAGAGFPARLGALLGKPVETIAINGGGATAVREALAGMPAQDLAKFRTVVWLISARDLLLPELPARRAGINWRFVPIQNQEKVATTPVAGRASLNGTLRDRSVIGDPRETPYPSAIVSTIFEDQDGSEHLVFFWAFRDRKPDAAGELVVGHGYRLDLIPLEDAAEAKSATRLDDFFRPDLKPWFAEKFEPSP